jgi:chemotaxis protein methyltransferase CheR
VDGMADRTEEIEIRLLLEALFQKYHFDFRGYAMASLKRRLKRGREHLGFATISAM